MSLAGAASAEYYFTSRIVLGLEHRVHWPIQIKLLRWLSNKCSASGSFRPILGPARFMSLAGAASAEYYFTSRIGLGREYRVHWPIQIKWIRWLPNTCSASGSFHPCNLKSSRVHEPSRSCECWISLYIENSFGTWIQSPLTDTNKITKVAFKQVFHFWIVSPMQSKVEPVSWA